MGFLENIFGIKQPADYTVKNNRTGKETPVRDVKELEKFVEQEQHENYAEKPDPFIQRIFR